MPRGRSQELGFTISFYTATGLAVLMLTLAMSQRFGVDAFPVILFAALAWQNWDLRRQYAALLGMFKQQRANKGRASSAA